LKNIFLFTFVNAWLLFSMNSNHVRPKFAIYWIRNEKVINLINFGKNVFFIYSNFWRKIQYYLFFMFENKYNWSKIQKYLILYLKTNIVEYFNEIFENIWFYIWKQILLNTLMKYLKIFVFMFKNKYFRKIVQQKLIFHLKTNLIVEKFDIICLLNKIKVF
jgi:hypothetical protein